MGLTMLSAYSVHYTARDSKVSFDIFILPDSPGSIFASVFPEQARKERPKLHNEEPKLESGAGSRVSTLTLVTSGFVPLSIQEMCAH